MQAVDLAYHDYVISTAILVHDPAFHGCEAMAQRRRTVVADPPVDEQALVTPAVGESAGEMFLAFGEDVHREDPRLPEVEVGLRALIEADEHQGRVHRHRGEGIGGEAGQVALFVPGGHHRHPGGEAPYHRLECAIVDHVASNCSAVLIAERSFAIRASRFDAFNSRAGEKCGSGHVRLRRTLRPHFSRDREPKPPTPCGISGRRREQVRNAGQGMSD